MLSVVGPLRLAPAMLNCQRSMLPALEPARAYVHTEAIAKCDYIQQRLAHNLKFSFANTPASYRSLSGPPGPKTPKKSDKSLLGPPAPGSQKVRKESRKSPEQTFSRLFLDSSDFLRLFPDFWGPTPGDFF